MTLGNFLKQIDPSLFQAYIFERYKSGENGHSNYKKPNFDDFKVQTVFPKPEITNAVTEEEFNSMFWDDSIFTFSDTHRAKKYLLDRKIPLEFLKRLYFTPNFKRFTSQFETEDSFELPEDARIIIPFYDMDKDLVAFQGRSLGSSDLRYITIKLNKDAPKIYGRDQIDTDKRVYILEGPFDSMFIPNAIATAGASITLDTYKNIQDRVFVLDNEPRNSDIAFTMMKVIEGKENICIWPKAVHEKDINAMILSGRTPEEILDIIEQNTFSGITARLKMKEWRRT